MKVLRVVACGTLLIGAASPAAQAPEPLATLAFVLRTITPRRL